MLQLCLFAAATLPRPVAPVVFAMQSELILPVFAKLGCACALAVGQMRDDLQRVIRVRAQAEMLGCPAECRGFSGTRQ